jgi:hypothetical protein
MYASCGFPPPTGRCPSSLSSPAMPTAGSLVYASLVHGGVRCIWLSCNTITSIVNDDLELNSRATAGPLAGPSRAAEPEA